MGEVDQQRSSNVVEFGHAMLYLYPMYDRILMASNLQASTEKKQLRPWFSDILRTRGIRTGTFPNSNAHPLKVVT